MDKFLELPLAEKKESVLFLKQLNTLCKQINQKPVRTRIAMMALADLAGIDGEEMSQILEKPKPVSTMFDQVIRFFDMGCIADSLVNIRATDLYQAFSEWWQCEKIDLPIPSQHQFGRMAGKRYQRCKKGGFSWYVGIRLPESGG